MFVHRIRNGVHVFIKCTIPTKTFENKKKTIPFHEFAAFFILALTTDNQSNHPCNWIMSIFILPFINRCVRTQKKKKTFKTQSVLNQFLFQNLQIKLNTLFFSKWRVIIKHLTVKTHSYIIFYALLIQITTLHSNQTNRQKNETCWTVWIHVHLPIYFSLFSFSVCTTTHPSFRLPLFDCSSELVLYPFRFASVLLSHRNFLPLHIVSLKHSIPFSIIKKSFIFIFLLALDGFSLVGYVEFDLFLATTFTPHHSILHNSLVFLVNLP